MFFLISILLMIISENQVSNLIIEEIKSDVIAKKIVLKPNSILGNSDLLTLKTSSVKKRFSENYTKVPINSSQDYFILKKNRNDKKMYIFYTKYFFSEKYALGYINN